MEKINKNVNEWLEWSLSADQSENGWESSFPRWIELLNVAFDAMKNSDLSLPALESLATVWAISSETEDIADFARDHFSECYFNLKRLAVHSDPRVRWQVFSVLSLGDEKVEPLLRRGIEDSEPYVQRRALLSLAQLRPADSLALARRFQKHSDPYIRLASINFLHSVKDEEAKVKLYDRYRKDSCLFVSEAARDMY